MALEALNDHTPTPFTSWQLTTQVKTSGEQLTFPAKPVVNQEKVGSEEQSQVLLVTLTDAEVPSAIPEQHEQSVPVLELLGAPEAERDPDEPGELTEPDELAEILAALIDLLGALPLDGLLPPEEPLVAPLPLTEPRDEGLPPTEPLDEGLPLDEELLDEELPACGPSTVTMTSSAV
jgi:hypothetical protein